MQRAYDALKDKGVVVLSISIDGPGEKVVKPYMAKNSFTFLTLIDQRMEVARQFGVRGTPSIFVVNREGKIVARGIGPFDPDTPEFAQYVQRLAAQSHG